MRKGQNFFQLPVTCRRGTKAEGGQPGVGKAVKSRAGGSDRPVDRPSAGRPPSLVSYCLNRRSDSGFICEIRARPGTVISAKKGIHFASHRKCAADGLDSRRRGNDRQFERDPIPNDTTSKNPISLRFHSSSYILGTFK